MHSGCCVENWYKEQGMWEPGGQLKRLLFKQALDALSSYGGGIWYVEKELNLKYAVI